MKDSGQILGKVRESFQTTFDINPDLVTMETQSSDIPGWDSVGHLSLASSLEQTFGISLDVDDLMEMEGVRQIVRVIETKLADGQQ